MDGLNHSELKDYGNRYFEGGQFQKAILFYSSAIKKQPNISIYFTNRALCFLKLGDFDRCIADCRQALELESMNIKAYFYMGQAYLEQENYDEALIRLVRAHDISLEQHKNFGDDITTSIRLAKRLRYEKLETKRNDQESELQNYLEGLIKESFTVKSKEILENVDGDASDSYETMSNDSQRRLSQVNELFHKLHEKRVRIEVPDYLCGRISFEVMRDPVISPSGITYDRAAISEHLHKVGHFDPITRQPLTEDMLIPNVSMKEVVYTFLEDNPWAENY